MRCILILFLLLLVVSSSSGQSKKRDKVKRKYRKVERVNENLPGAVFHGRVRDIYRNPLAGACVEAEGLNRRVHTNEEGRYLLTNLPPGSIRIKVSYIGYRTKYFDYYLQAGQNTHYIALDQDDVHLEPLTVIAQKREQQIPDIPLSVSVVSNFFAEQTGVFDFAGMAELIPGLFYEDLGAGNSAFFINGSTGNPGFPGVAPSVAVLFDQIPVDPQNGFSGELFDMERVEVLKGPQNVLAGRNAYSGAVHFISKKPADNLGGYLKAGGGNFGNKEFRGAVNLPVAEDILYIRTAGFYHKRNGYVRNTPGNYLNGKNSLGGRLSIRLLPAFNHQVNLKLNYQKFDEPGLSYMNRWYPAGEENDLFSYSAIINTDELSGYEMELMDAALTYRIFRNEHNYWTAISSYRRTCTSSVWDGDGTDLPALYMNENANAELFFQEIRYNFSRRSRTNGSLGIDYTYRNRDMSQYLISNDRLIADVLKSPGNFILPRESPFPVFQQPLDPDPLTGISLSGTQHIEEMFYESPGWSAQAFINFTHRLSRKIFFSGGVRAVYDCLKLTGESVSVDGNQSVLGGLAGTSPNFMYKPFGPETITKSGLSFTGRAGFTYRFNENANIFLQSSRGRRPQVLQFSREGDPGLIEAEIVNSFEGGWKFLLFRRIYMEANGFYRRHKNVQTILWTIDPEEGLLAGKGKAASYGAEAGVKIALIKGVDLFGNYVWLSSAFDSADVNELDYIYAGNSFAFAPEHSFTAGVSMGTNIVPYIRFFLVPWYSWKSHFWFTEANVTGLEQSAYGILNVNTGLELAKPNVILSIYGTNLLEQKYISSAGHWGGLSGLPTFVPGPPRMSGARLTWRF